MEFSIAEFVTRRVARERPSTSTYMSLGPSSIGPTKCQRNVCNYASHATCFKLILLRLLDSAFRTPGWYFAYICVPSLFHTSLPGECWAKIQQFALIWLSSSLHPEACNALGASDGVFHSRICHETGRSRAPVNEHLPVYSPFSGTWQWFAISSLFIHGRKAS